MTSSLFRKLEVILNEATIHGGLASWTHKRKTSKQFDVVDIHLVIDTGFDSGLSWNDGSPVMPDELFSWYDACAQMPVYMLFRQIDRHLDAIKNNDDHGNVMSEWHMCILEQVLGSKIEAAEPSKSSITAHEQQVSFDAFKDRFVQFLAERAKNGDNTAPELLAWQLAGANAELLSESGFQGYEPLTKESVMRALVELKAAYPLGCRPDKTPVACQEGTNHGSCSEY